MLAGYPPNSVRKHQVARPRGDENGNKNEMTKMKCCANYPSPGLPKGEDMVKNVYGKK